MYLHVGLYNFANDKFIWFKFVLESQVVECSMESFMHKDFRSYFIFHLAPTIDSERNLHERACKQMQIASPVIFV